MRERLNAILATGATATQWLLDAHEVLSLLVTLLTLAWWVRLWIRDPRIKPPQIERENDDENRKN